MGTMAAVTPPPPAEAGSSAKMPESPDRPRSEQPVEQPVVIVCVGMAGSGKTTFMQQINAHLHGKKEPPYVINLDPAVIHSPFESNIDIRDSVNYKEVMKQYNLGPNGGILTSLNLFATKVDQIVNILEKRTASQAPARDSTSPSSSQPPIKHVIVDTPGQIEVFVWSASGTILLESLASSFPTVIAYVIDTPRTASTSTFMSNMLYACSILYKTKLPMVLVFNKTDVKDCAFAREWMTDHDAFQAALRADEEGNAFGGVEGTRRTAMDMGDAGGGLGGAGGMAASTGSGYMGSLLNSMSLMLDEFYAHLKVVGVSSLYGTGIDNFFDAVRDKADEFRRDYQPELDRKREEREKNRKKARERELDKMMRGMSMGGGAASSSGAGVTVGDIKGADGGDEGGIDEERLKFPSDDDDDDDEYDNNMDDDDDREGLQARYEAAMAEENNLGADPGFSHLWAKAAQNGRNGS